MNSDDIDEGGWGTPDAPSRPWQRLACAIIIVALFWAALLKICMRGY